MNFVLRSVMLLAVWIRIICCSVSAALHNFMSSEESADLAKNVFGEDLAVCSADPVTGFFRNGKCDTCGDDVGMHTVCAVMTADFLRFSQRAGNDLSTPVPEYGFPGLNPGDRWCLCLPRWLEALEAGMAPKLALRATHISAIEHIAMEVLLEYAVDADGYVHQPPEVED